MTTMNNKLPRLCENFLNHLEILNKSNHTVRLYRQGLEAWARYEKLEYGVSAEYLACMQTSDFYEFLGSLKRKDGEKLNSSSVARIVAAIKSFYRYLHEDIKLISINPTEGLKQPKIKRALPKYLKEEEMISLLQSVNKLNSKYPERDYAILSVFLNTGVRESELIGINTDDINGDTLIVRGKGNKEREIPLTENCINAIDRYLRTKIHHDGKALFTSERNNRICTETVIGLVKKYLSVIGKGDLSPHKLRHSCFTNLASNGTDIRTIQDIAGHANISTTTIYLHVNNSAKRKALANTKLASVV